MQRGLVSTIIPVYNRPAMLVDAVNSVLSQTYRPIEIIIVDDGSTDNTPQAARKLKADHPEINVVMITNSGPGLAREAGRKIASGEFIQYLDSDDLLRKDKFSLQVAGLNKNSHCGVSYCRQYYSDMNGTILDHAFMRSGEQHDTMFPAMLAGRLWGTPGPLYRKSLLDQCGAWLDLTNEEDWEYDCRVASKGVQLHYCRDALVTIRSHNEGHFGNVSGKETAKIHDRSAAYQAIYQHALDANIGPETDEFKRFNRMLFSLSRQCGAVGLVHDSKKLFALSYKSRRPTRAQNFQYHFYRLGSSLIGWENMGKLSILLDRLR